MLCVTFGSTATASHPHFSIVVSRRFWLIDIVTTTVTSPFAAVSHHREYHSQVSDFPPHTNLNYKTRPPCHVLMSRKMSRSISPISFFLRSAVSINAPLCSRHRSSLIAESFRINATLRSFFALACISISSFVMRICDRG